MAQRANNVRPADFTGRQKALLAEEQGEVLKAREGEIALANKATAEEKSQPVDFTEAPQAPAALETKQVGLAEQVKEFRVNTDLEAVTIGKGTSYDFEIGRSYKAPRAVYDHLEERGYVWH